MALPSDFDKAALQSILLALLERYEGVLIVVRDREGDAAVVSGGSSTQGLDDEAHRSFVNDLPAIIHVWMHNQPPVRKIESN